jgi:hypothetical protein
MRNVALQTDLPDAPRLRLLPVQDGAPQAPLAEHPADSEGGRPALRLLDRPSAEERHPVLVAGEDSAGRAAVLRDLTQSMPPSTIFEEARAFWEVLVRAPASSMVILSGELDDLPAESLMQMLAHRHPGLPVVSLDAPAHAAL